MVAPGSHITLALEYIMSPECPESWRSKNDEELLSIASALATLHEKLESGEPLDRSRGHFNALAGAMGYPAGEGRVVAVVMFEQFCSFAGSVSRGAEL